jgi:hypothetical protein
MIQQLQNSSGRPDRGRHSTVNSLRSLADCSDLTPVIIDIRLMTTTIPIFLDVNDERVAIEKFSMR